MDSKVFRAWRTERQWSQEKTARNLGVTLRTVQYWEAGQVPIPETVQRLIAAIDEVGKVFAPYEPQPSGKLGCRGRADTRDEGCPASVGSRSDDAGGAGAGCEPVAGRLDAP